MNNLLFAILFLLAAFSASAREYGRFGIGVSGSYYVWKGYDTSDNLEDKQTSYSISAAFSMMLGQSIEMRPYLVFGSMTHESFEVKDDGSLAFGGGIGFYWHVLKSDHLRMGPGAVFDITSISDNYPGTDTATTLIPGFRIPMMLEFVMTRNVAFRIEYTMFGFHTFFSTANNGSRDNYTYIMVFPMDPTRYEDSMSVFLGSQMLKLGLTFRF